jgi:hypothetical protein
MTTLLHRCQLLDTKLKALALAKRHAADHKLIQQRTQEWRDRNEKLKALNARTACLSLAAEDSKSLLSRRVALRQNAGTILARLKQDDDINELTRDAVWKRLLKSSEGLAEDLQAAAQKAWQVYLEEHATLENPVALRRRTPQTPQNNEALQAYQASYTAYENIKRLPIPRNGEDLAQLQTHVAACREAFSQLSFDLPVEVKRFYEAISAGNATLAIVNPTVLGWLAEHGHLDRFRVRSVGQ